VRQGSELAIRIGAEAQAMAGLGAIGRNAEALFARQDQLHWPPEAAGRQRDQRRARRHRGLGPERATDEGTDDADVVGRHAQLLRNAMLQAVHHLARLVDRELVAGPQARRGV
jgi:hypothetical protein